MVTNENIYSLFSVVSKTQELNLETSPGVWPVYWCKNTWLRPTKPATPVLCKACFVVVQAQTDTRSLSEGVDLAFGTKRDDIATPPAEIVATHSGS